jgi:hypothetical protein
MQLLKCRTIRLGQCRKQPQLDSSLVCQVCWVEEQQGRGDVQAESQQLSAVVSTPERAGLKSLLRGAALTDAPSLAVLTPLRAEANSLLSVRRYNGKRLLWSRNLPHKAKGL